MVQKDKVFELTDAVIDSEPEKVAEALDDLINNGKDPVFITNNLINHFRDLMILKSAGKPTSDMAFSQDELDKARASYEQANSSYKASLSRYQQALASLKQVQRNAERTTIFAPQDGIVTKLTVEKGEKVVGTEMMQGTEMMVVSDLNIMNAIVEVDENDMFLIAKKLVENHEVELNPQTYVLEWEKDAFYENPVFRL